MIKTLRMAVLGTWVAITSSVVWAADDAVQDQAKTQFNNMATFFIDVLSGPLAKVFALVFLIAAIWAIVNKEYGKAFGCVLALLALIFMPQLLAMFDR